MTEEYSPNGRSQEPVDKQLSVLLGVTFSLMLALLQGAMNLRWISMRCTSFFCEFGADFREFWFREVRE